MLKPSSFDNRYWGCPNCDWPLNPEDDQGDGGVTCACGGWVPLPEIKEVPPTLAPVNAHLLGIKPTDTIHKLMLTLDNSWIQVTTVALFQGAEMLEQGYREDEVIRRIKFGEIG